MKPRKFETIDCPRCGWQYLPAEIYTDRAFTGRPYHIERLENGKIVEYDGTSVDQFETYTCDCCNTEFRVMCKMTFVTEETRLANFDEEYIAPLITKKDLFTEQ